MDKKPIIWSYVVAYDEGSAPCVDNNLLTLCICKPLIRRRANIGDWIILSFTCTMLLIDIS